MAINFESFPLKEIRRGRELQWDPHSIDLTQDRKDWLTLSAQEQELLLAQVFGFLLGERAVAHDLAPLQTALRAERGHFDEEMYITQQVYEESTHVEFFQRWLNEVLPGTLGEDIPFPGGSPSPVLQEHLPKAMMALHEDKSPEAQMRATVCYHQIVEGVLAELGYDIFYKAIDPKEIMRGLREGLRNIQKDESRHIAFGTYFAQRLIRDYPQTEAIFIDEMERFRTIVDANAELIFDFLEEPYPFGFEKQPYITLGRTLHKRRTEAVLQGHLMEA